MEINLIINIDNHYVIAPYDDDNDDKPMTT